MLGPEAARVALRDRLIADLPAQLSAVRERLDAAWPPDPKLIALADQISPDEAIRANAFPLLLITSHELSGWGKHESGPNIGATWTCRYPVKIGILIDSPRNGDYEQASVGRDRYVLALRELLLTDPALGQHAQAILSPYSEETGPVGSTLQGRVLAGAEIGFTIEQVETLDSDAPTFESNTTDVTALP